MGIYLNPNNTNFAGSLKNPMYIDKTMMLHELNHFIDIENKYICVSRPRRFGKTIAGNMIAAYYSKGCDSRKLFAPYKIAKDESFAENLNKFNVIQIDMNSEFQNILDKDMLLHFLSEKIRDEMRESFPSVVLKDNYSIAECMLRIYSATGEHSAKMRTRWRKHSM